MSGRIPVLLVADIFQHLHAKKSSGQFNKQLQQHSQQLLDEIKQSHELKAVVAQVTLDRVFNVIQAWYDTATAQSIINTLRQSGLEILPKSTSEQPIFLDDDDKTIRAAEIGSALEHQIVELITHFPGYYASGVDSPLSIVKAADLLSRINRKHLERVYQLIGTSQQLAEPNAPFSIESDTLVSNDSSISNDSPVFNNSSRVETEPGSAPVAPMLLTEVQGEPLFFLLVVILIYFLAILSVLNRKMGSPQEEVAAKIGISGLGMVDITHGLLNSNFSELSHRDPDSFEVAWASILFLVTAPLVQLTQNREVSSPNLHTPNLHTVAMDLLNTTSTFIETATQSLQRVEVQSSDLTISDAAFKPVLNSQPPSDSEQIEYAVSFFAGLPVKAPLPPNLTSFIQANIAQITSQSVAQTTAESAASQQDSGTAEKNAVQISTMLDSTNLQTTISLDNPNLASPIDGLGGNRAIAVQANSGRLRVDNFGGVGRGVTPAPEIIAEVDTLLFGFNLTVQNMILTQVGTDLEITFEGVESTAVVLTQFKLENLDNLAQGNGVALTIGNILQGADLSIQDYFDIMNADWTGNMASNPNTVTFLNDYNNYVMGFWGSSNDVINGQGGNDILFGLEGDDILRGGEGDDILSGGQGKNRLVGNSGRDMFVLSRDGFSQVRDFMPSQDFIGLSTGITFADLQIEELVEGGLNSTWISLDNDDVPLMQLVGVPASDLTSDLFLNLVGFWSATTDDIGNQNRNHILLGSNGNDLLYGGTGDDTLIGGLGRNVMLGGAGSDTFGLDKRSFNQVRDFTVGQDWIGLPSDIQASDLQIDPVVECGSSSLWIYLQNDLAPLMQLVGLQPADLISNYFLPLPLTGGTLPQSMSPGL